MFLSIRSLFIAFVLIINSGFAGEAPQGSKPKPGVAGVCLRVAADITTAFINTSVDVARGVGGDRAAIARIIRSVGLGRASRGWLPPNHSESYTHELEIGKDTSQDQSGRCWIFAFCNTVRSFGLSLPKRKMAPDFELSESWFYYLSMLEKANFFLLKTANGIFDQVKNGGGTAGIKIDPAALRSGLSDPGLSDGGWWNWMSYLYKKYGAVPKSMMPETFNSSNTAALNEALIDGAMKDFRNLMLEVQKIIEANKGKPDTEVVAAVEKFISAYVEQARARIFSTLETTLGPLPKPDQKFAYRLNPKKDGTTPAAEPTNPAVIKSYTPKEFAAYLGFDPDEFVMVSANPFKAENMWVELADTSIGVPGAHEKPDNMRMLNVSLDRMRDLVVASVADAKMPVWIGADFNGPIDYGTNIMHPQILATDSVLGFSGPENRPMTREERIMYGMTSMNHAVVISKVDLTGRDGAVVKMFVENSWGPQYQGFHMYREWFDQFVHMVVVPKSILSQTELAAIAKEPIPLTEDQWELRTSRTSFQPPVVPR